jgi:hypothetical protein
MNTRLAEAIKAEAQRIGANPADLATVMSYETGGTFDPWEKGPTTQWGVHRGLIQMGQPQRDKYNYREGMPIEDAVAASANYLVDAGFKPGMGLLEMYSAINAGGIGEKYYGRSDAGNGGAPGTVRDKVATQMEGHKQKAVALLNGEFQPSERTYFETPAGESRPETNPFQYQDVSAPSPATVVDVNARPEGPSNDGFWADFSDSFQSSSITSQSIRWMTEGGIDPDFQIGEDRGMKLSKQYPEMYHDFLFNSSSDLVLRQRMQWADEDVKRQERLAGGGWRATGAGLLAGAADPIPLALGLATGGIGAGAVAGLGMAARVGIGSAVGGVSNAAVDWASGAATDNPYADPLLAGGAGTVFGALGGALARSAGSQFESSLAHQIGNRFEAENRGLIPARSETPRFDEDIVPVSGPSGSGGAARNTQMRDSLIGDDAGLSIEMRDEDVGRGFGGWLRKGDVTGQMTTDANPVTRMVGANFFEETAGFTDNSVVPDSVNSKMTAMHRKYVGDFNMEFMPAKKAYISEGGQFSLNLAARGRRGDEFNKLVTAYVRDPNPSPDVSPHVAKAGQAYRRAMSNFAREMKEAGLWSGNTDENYISLIANHNKIAQLDELIHQDAMENFFKRAIMKHTPELGDDIATRMARGYWGNIRKAGYGIDDGLSRSLHLNDRDGFKKAFFDNLDNQNLLTDEELEKVFDTLSGMMDATKKTVEPSKGVGYLKRRTLMDYNEPFMVPLRTPNGGETHMKLSVNDLFEDDAELLFHRYARTMAGRVSFAKQQFINPTTGEVMMDGIKSETDLAKLMNMVRESYRLMPGHYNDKKKALDNALENIEFGWKRINGIPVFDNSSGYAKWARRIKAVQFIRLMSNMGLNQVQEGWKLISLTGFRASMSQLPAIRTMVTGINGGAFKKDKLLTELTDMTGIGLEGLWNKFDFRLDEDRIGEGLSGRIGQRVDAALEAGQQLTAQVSFMRAISDYQQRWAMKAITQQMAAMARKAKIGDDAFDFSKIKIRDRERLASIGLGDKEAQLLFKNLLKHSEFDNGKIVGVNVGAWDAEAVSKFRIFMGRYTDRLVQANDYGALSKWMSHPVASMFIQFRSFVFGAWAKSTRWTANHGILKDPRMMVMVMGELAAGTATYAVRQAGQTSTEDGYDKFWDEDMKPENLIKNGIARTATASVVPMFADSLLMLTPLGPQFGQARSSGSPTETFFGTPAADQINSARAFSSGLMDSVWNDREMTQGEIRSGVRAFVPLANWVPFTAALGALIEDRPVSSR